MSIKCLSIIQLLFALVLISFAAWATGVSSVVVAPIQIILFIVYVAGFFMCEKGRIRF